VEKSLGIFPLSLSLILHLSSSPSVDDKNAIDLNRQEEMAKQQQQLPKQQEISNDRKWYK